MAETKTSDVVFFLGAGASAPFGIPTMKQLVVDFEQFLSGYGTKGERAKYLSIKQRLGYELGREVDLEAIFTVIDGMLNYSSERLGMLSLYSAVRFVKPNKQDLETYRSLRGKFQSFVREKCLIPEGSFDKIGKVYKDFFNRFALELQASGTNSKGGHYYQNDWAIFTTNYDTCLECYWRKITRIGVDVGFQSDDSRAVHTLRSRRFLQEGTGGIHLFKLHGSISWKIDRETDEVTEEDIPTGLSITGRHFAGEAMLYPIAEKELYLDPYISMLLRLNWELEKNPIWIVIGYSFNDPTILEIFLKKSNRHKHLILVHKRANEVCANRLRDFKGKISPMEREFGCNGKFPSVNYSIILRLKGNPKFGRGKVFG